MIAKGGGYVNAASEGHYAFLWNQVLAARQAGSDLSVFVLAYGTPSLSHDLLDFALIYQT